MDYDKKEKRKIDKSATNRLVLKIHKYKLERGEYCAFFAASWFAQISLPWCLPSFVYLRPFLLHLHKFVTRKKSKKCIAGNFMQSCSWEKTRKNRKASITSSTLIIDGGSHTFPLIRSLMATSTSNRLFYFAFRPNKNLMRFLLIIYINFPISLKRRIEQNGLFG